MFESLSERLERSFKILKGEGRITEVNVAETLKDVRKAQSCKNLYRHGKEQGHWSECADINSPQPVDD